MLPVAVKPGPGTHQRRRPRERDGGDKRRLTATSPNILGRHQRRNNPGQRPIRSTAGTGTRRHSGSKKGPSCNGQIQNRRRSTTLRHDARGGGSDLRRLPTLATSGPEPSRSYTWATRAWTGCTREPRMARATGQASPRTSKKQETVAKNAAEMRPSK